MVAVTHSCFCKEPYHRPIITLVCLAMGGFACKRVRLCGLKVKMQKLNRPRIGGPNPTFAVSQKKENLWGLWLLLCKLQTTNLLSLYSH